MEQTNNSFNSMIGFSSHQPIDDIYDVLNSDVSLKSLSCIRFSCKNRVKNYERKKGELNISRFFLIIGDEITFEFDTKSGIKKLCAKANDLIYLPPDVEYRCTWGNPENMDYITIHFELFKDLSEPFVLSDQLFLIATDKDGLLYNSFLKLYNTYHSGEVGYKLRCKALFFDIFRAVCLDVLKNKYKEKYSDVYKAIMYIDNNYLEEIDTNSLAMLCKKCQSGFRRAFKKQTNMTPVEYRNYLRIQKAAELIKYENYTVTEAAFFVGINDLSYFNRMFKKYLNIAPSKLKE